MKVIAITGTPGTGKTTIGEPLAKKLKYQYINLTEFIEKKNISCSYDKKRRCLVVNPKVLVKALKKVIKKNTLLDSHLSHEYPNLDLCIVCRCPLKELKTRLSKRKYSKQKIQENLECEAFDVCLTEAIERFDHPTHIVTTDKEVSIDQLAKEVKCKI
jgi:adenylate kinase